MLLSIIQIDFADLSMIAVQLFLLERVYKGDLYKKDLKYVSFLEELHYTDYLRSSVKVRFALHLDRHFGNLVLFFRSKKKNTVIERGRELYRCVRLLTSFANATSDSVYKKGF